jgi:hypothetical protein
MFTALLAVQEEEEEEEAVNAQLRITLHSETGILYRAIIPYALHIIIWMKERILMLTEMLSITSNSIDFPR